MDKIQLIIGTLGGIIGAIGGGLGIWSFFSARKDESEFWKFYFDIREHLKTEMSVWDPSDPEDIKLCELMVRKGLLERSKLSGYKLPGQSLRVNDIKSRVV